MPLTDKAALLHLAHALGKATGLGVRVAEQGRVTDYVSPFHLHPDPAGPELPALLNQTHRAGVSCTAAVASRGAIEGGMDSRTAFLLSDLYIQRIELLRDIPAVLKLREEIMVDYAERVRRLRYRVGNAGDVFSACAKYVDENLYAPLRVEDVAAALGYSRSYLSTRFRQQTGMTLTRYILQQKVFEAQRLLQFSGESLRDIANTFRFSSQSHFQNVFKSVTGETPMAFRRRVGKSKHN